MEIRYLVTLVLALIFLAVLLFAAYSAYTQYIYPEFAPKYKNVDSTTKNYVESQFDLFISNLYKCKTTPKQTCLCKEIIPNYPNTLSNDFSFVLENTKAGLKISMFYKNREEIKNTTIDNFFYVSASYTNQIKENSPKLKSLITFKEGKVFLDDKQVISPDFYKTSSARIAIFTGGDLNKINSLQICY